jgi:hypothetical protein
VERACIKSSKKGVRFYETYNTEKIQIVHYSFL